MKKALLILALALAALSACQKSGPAEETVAATYSLSQLSFHFSVQYPTETKAVKSGWTEGDKIFVFFSGVTTRYVTLSYSESAWATPAVHGEGSPELPSSGLLTAIYLPYGNSATPSYSDDRWSFSDVADSYFFKAEKVEYQITDSGNAMGSLNAELYMEMPAGYAQFFIPNADAAAPVRLACNLMKTGGLSGIASDGTVAENTSGTAGDWITGYNATVGEATGYYASGKPIENPGLDCYFVLETESAAAYKHYYKLRNTPIAVRGAYKLPAPSAWTAVSTSDYVTMANVQWKEVNDGASLPWEPGLPVASGARSATVPNDVAWTALLNGTNIRWIPMTVANQAGSLVVEEYEANQFRYIFLPRVDYWSITETHYLHFNESGVAALYTDGAPVTAYIRQIKDSYHGGFNPPEPGGDI